MSSVLSLFSIEILNIYINIEEWRMQMYECIYRKQTCGGQLVLWIREYVDVFSADHTLITLAHARFQQYGTRVGQMAVAEEGQLLRVRIVFWSYMHKETVLQLPSNFILKFKMLTCQQKSYVHVAWKWTAI